MIVDSAFISICQKNEILDSNLNSKKVIHKLIEEKLIRFKKKVRPQMRWEKMNNVNQNSKSRLVYEFYEWQVFEVEEVLRQNKVSYFELNNSKYPLMRTRHKNPIVGFRREMTLLDQFDEEILNKNNGKSPTESEENTKIASVKYAKKISISRSIDLMRCLSEKAHEYEKEGFHKLSQKMKSYLIGLINLLILGKKSLNEQKIRKLFVGEKFVLGLIEQNGVIFFPGRLAEIVPDPFKQILDVFNMEFSKFVADYDQKITSEQVFYSFEKEHLSFFYHIYQLHEIWNNQMTEFWYWEMFTHIKSMALMVETILKETLHSKESLKILLTPLLEVYSEKNIHSALKNANIKGWPLDAKSYAEFKKNFQVLTQIKKPFRHLLIFYLIRNFCAHSDNLNHDDYFSDKIQDITEILVKVLLDIFILKDSGQNTCSTDVYTPLEKECAAFKGISEQIKSIVNYQVITLDHNDPDSFVGFKTELHQMYFNIMLLDFFNFNMPDFGISEKDKNRCALERILTIAKTPILNTNIAPLKEIVTSFQNWLEQDVKFIVEDKDLNLCFFPTVDLEIPLKITRKEFIKICGNISKHNLFGLTRQGGLIQKIFKRSGHDLSSHDAILIMNDFYDIFSPILGYHAGTITEFLNNIQWAIHEYLTPTYLKSKEEFWDKGLKLQRYKYIYPDEMNDPYMKDIFWSLMNDVRTGPYIPKFKSSEIRKRAY